MSASVLDIQTGRPVPAAMIDCAAIFVADLKVLHEAYNTYDQKLSRLAGRKLRPSLIRERLMVMIVMESLAERPRRLTYFQGMLSEMASKSHVRIETSILARCGLAETETTSENKRCVLVRPTPKLVQFVLSETLSLGSVLTIERRRRAH
jgi:predicted component of type VI protein secretion system